MHSQGVSARTAIVTDSVEIDYATLAELIAEGAAYLEAAGVEQDSVVGLLIADEVQHLIASLSLLAVGAGQITLATHDQPAMRDELADRVSATHLLGEQSEQATADRVLLWPADRESRRTSTHWQRDPASGGRLFLRTSGTTGRTNILAFSEAQIGLQAQRHPEYAGERLLRLAGIEHNNSKRHRLYCVWNGGTNVFIDHGHADLVSFVRDKDVTCLDISRMHAEGLPHLKEAAALGGIKIRTGGSAVPYATRQAIEQAVSRQLFVRYASSETGAIAMARPGEHDSDECSGRPIDGVELRILDQDGAPLPPGETGEIAIRAPGMVDGYLDNPEQTALRFRDGWFHPGDIGYVRPDGQLVVQGRKDEMIIMNGLNIFPKEIEAALEGHPEIAYAAALALPSRIHGDIPVAAVELAGDSLLTPPEIQRWAHPLLGLRAPKRIVIVDSLPRNSQGKVAKRALLPLFERK